MFFIVILTIIWTSIWFLIFTRDLAQKLNYKPPSLPVSINTSRWKTDIPLLPYTDTQTKQKKKQKKTNKRKNPTAHLKVISLNLNSRQSSLFVKFLPWVNSFLPPPGTHCHLLWYFSIIFIFRKIHKGIKNKQTNFQIM